MKKLEKFYLELRDILRLEADYAKTQGRESDYRALMGAAKLAQRIFAVHYDRGNQ